MPNYYFDCKECDELWELYFSMKNDEGRNSATCPKCDNKLKRVFTVPHAIVKGTMTPSFVGNKDQAFIDCDGRPVRMNFIDHGPRSGIDPGSPASGIPGARIDEKTGKAVVDVASNVPDPLGQMERAKKKAQREERFRVDKKNVNTPVKTRK